MNPEQWLSLKWNGGSTMSDRWLNQSKIIQSFGIDEADAKVRALAIGKEVMYAEEPEKEEDEYGTFWFE